jgi:hypothetical protein
MHVIGRENLADKIPILLMGIVYFSNTWEKYSSFSLQKD